MYKSMQTTRSNLPWNKYGLFNSSCSENIGLDQTSTYGGIPNLNATYTDHCPRTASIVGSQIPDSNFSIYTLSGS
jgi:hypothetical protein